MTTRCYVGSLLVLLGAWGAAGAPADVVTLSDGSKLIGKVAQMGDGKLVLETQFAGMLEIDSTMVATIQTDEPVSVGMDTGDRLIGPIEWKPEVERAVVQTELGGVPVSLERIEAIWPKDGKSPEVIALEEQLAQEKEAFEAALAKWSGTLEAGVIYQDGNTERLNARGRGELVRTAPKDLLKFYIAGEYVEEDKSRTSHEIKGGAYYEHLLNTKLFAYGRIELEYDEFEELDLRLSTGGGVGYYWLKEPDHELKTRAGIGFLHEAYFFEPDRDAVEGEIGLDYRVDLAPWVQFVQAAAYYPTFESVRDYRLVSDSALLIPLSEDKMWKLKLGALYEFKALPAEGRERLDQTYYANVQLNLK